MGRIGMGELLVIFLVVLILFGAKRLPEIGQAIGKALKEFKRASQDVVEEVQNESIKKKDDQKS